MSLSTAARAAPPMARSMAWGPLLAGTGVIAGVGVATRPWDGHALSLSVVRVVVGLAAVAAAFALDDPAGVTIAASPTTAGQRQTTRMTLIVVAVVVVAGGACLSLAAIAGTSELPGGRILLESVGMVLAASACAVTLGGDRGASAFAGGVLASIVVQRHFPDYALFGLAPVDVTWDRATVAWLVVVLTSAATLAARSRDPVGRRRVGTRSPRMLRGRRVSE